MSQKREVSWSTDITLVSSPTRHPKAVMLFSTSNSSDAERDPVAVIASREAAVRDPNEPATKNRQGPELQKNPNSRKTEKRGHLWNYRAHRKIHITLSSTCFSFQHSLVTVVVMCKHNSARGTFVFSFRKDSWCDDDLRSNFFKTIFHIPTVTFARARLSVLILYFARSFSPQQTRSSLILTVWSSC